MTPLDWYKLATLLPCDAESLSVKLHGKDSTGWKFELEGYPVAVLPGRLEDVVNTDRFDFAWNPKTNVRLRRI